jgi:hypothetical protein
MSRSGYCDDIDDVLAHGRWRGMVASAIRGKRGQAFLKEMLAAMDAMPIKRLIADDLETADAVSCSHWGMFETDSVCAIGAVGKARGVDMSKLDPEDYDTVAGTFGIASVLAQEIVYMNDEAHYWATDDHGYFKKDESGKHYRITPEERFQKMRQWIEGCIRKEPAEGRTP